MTEPRIALVTGASGGIGRATTALLAFRGWQVLAASRSPLGETPAGVSQLTLDLTDEDSLQAAAATVLDTHGRIDALVHVAGYCDAGPLEVAEPEAVRRQFETNAFGPLRLTQLLLPAMRAQGSGRIVTIGTVMGGLPLPLLGLYGASKAAMDAFNEVLRMELKRFGIHAILVIPGTVLSGFDAIALANLREQRERSGPQYGTPVERLDQMIENSAAKGLAPEAVAEMVLRALTARRPRHCYALGIDARATLALRRVITPPLRDWILRAPLRL
jgi:NAD(P)-dependent dehydrogenase (short-subunit alcohol dehydrogenase family)